MAKPTEPWTRGERIALVAVAAIAAFALARLHHGWLEPSTEAAWTLAEARRMATGVRLLERPVADVPSLATLLAPFAGGERLDVGRVHLATSLAGLLAVALLFVHERPRSGWPTAALGVLAVAASPGFLRACVRVSDVAPGLAAFLGCALVERWSARRGRAGASFVSGLAVALAAWISAANLVLLPAALLVRTFAPAQAAGWRRFLREHVPLVAGVIVLSLVPTTVFRCPMLLWPEPGGRPLGALELAAAIGGGLARDASGRPTAAWAVGIAGGLALACRRSSGTATGAAAALLLAGLAMAPGSRMTPDQLLPVLALGLPALLAALREHSGRLLGRTAGTVVACVVALAWIGLRFDPRDDRARLRAEHESLVEFATEVGARLPEDARVASGLGASLAIFLDRPVLELDARFDPRRPDELEARLDRQGIDTLALYPRVPGDLALARYALRRYGERDPERVETIPPGFLVRVRP